MAFPRRRALRAPGPLRGSGLAVLLLGLLAALTTGPAGPAGATHRPPPLVQPIDPQHWRNPDDMTWGEYRPVPGTHWADPQVKPTRRMFKGALVLLDYPDEEFSVTRAAGTAGFGNPQPVAASIPRGQVPAFYRDFLNKPGVLNHGHTINEYWMEDSGGRLGVELTAFGVYRMPWKSYQYGIEPDMNPGACPSGDTCGKDIRADGRRAWVADAGAGRTGQFDFVFYLTAGVDESSTWQEFGPMRFNGPGDIPAAWGPPSPLTGGGNAARTRYVPWTSWRSAARIWPNAADGSSIQAESSGMATYAHEFSHILGIGDNYNNPYGTPLSRSYTGIWGMLSRGSFNGPGGPHTRWRIPATAGGSMGAQHVLRDKLKLGIVDEKNVLRLDRDALAGSGPVVARVTARAAPPGTGGLSGVNITLSGDRSAACDRDTNPRCDGGGYDNYTLEVVDRMGMDSFTPDSGVLLSKTKNADDAPFAWVIDAHPEDIGLVDFIRPDGTPQKITMGDYRQLSDALFHAGADSGSAYEYVDQANRLHFYVLNVHRDAAGVLSYDIGVRSLDGAGSRPYGLALGAGTAHGKPADGRARCTFPLRSSGAGQDIYRLAAATTSHGWSAWLPNRLATAAPGGTTTVDLAVTARPGAARDGTIRLLARSESDPGKVATATCALRK
ncbi:M6 family metalloprotease domain-containing protein [Streptomyces sp. NPDC052396]|uniref:M6 family metalloprotease domain-containing protein n=1 Tax=Streptomyces sp. NPDC052396 TaxID=3365689 RepID=UPI0037D57348